MLEVCLIGTGGMMPLTNRFLTSLYVRYEGKSILIDCGESTQVAIRKASYSTYPIDYILITHFHADHISGLPGLLLSMGNAGRTNAITIVGPKGITKIVNSLRIIAPELPFKINFIEIEDNFNFLTIGNLTIEFFKLKHKILCYGYNIKLARLPKFIVENAQKLNIPIKYWNKLQHGIECFDENNNILYTPNMVMGDFRKGIKVSYFTDTRPCDNIITYTKDCDLMIGEGMYGNNEKLANAKSYMHMMMTETCEIAKENKPKVLWLTHYSPSENKPIEYLNMLTNIFPYTKIPKDGKKIILKFE